MTILLLVFWGRNPRTKLKTVLRACSAASSEVPFLVVVTFVAATSLTSCFFLTGIGVETGLTMELALDEVYVVEEDIDGSADVRRGLVV